MEDLNFVYQDQMNAFGNLTSEELVAAAFGDDYQNAYFSESLSPHLFFNPPPLELEEATQRCFANPIEVVNPRGSRISGGASVNQHPGTKSERGKRAIPNSRSTTLTPFPQNHIMAERQRREKLSQHFIALIAIVPGLKKMDKTSILGCFIDYIKEMQERVKTLEEQTANNTTESVVYVKKFQIPSGDYSPATSENSTKSANILLPEIQARVSDKNVLIRIHCERQKGVLANVLAEIEKLHLFVISESIMPFGNSTQNITVVARMEEEFNMSVQDLMKNLHMVLHPSCERRYSGPGS